VRAAVLDGSPWALRVDDHWPEPSAGSGQVVVRVRGVGICGSDLALVSGRWRRPSVPWVPGHEAVGEIVSAGPGVPSSRIGQRVVIEPNIPCFTCPPCLAGLTSACTRRVSLGFNAPGALAELVAIPAGFAWPVPDDWTDADAVCLEPLTVALAAIRRSAGAAGSATTPSGGGSAGVPTRAARCLVLGAGSQGLLLCVALVAQGITPSVTEPNPGRLELAASLGAVPLPPGSAHFDVIYETSGTAAALADAVSLTAVGGTIVLIGLSGGDIPVDVQRVVRRQLHIQGSLTYDHPGDFADAVTRASPRPGRVLRACYPLEEAAQAFRAAGDVPGKTWITL
jgi:threonine dehydrogenase-like Zn-dependent dehydrogenase